MCNYTVITEKNNTFNNNDPLILLHVETMRSKIKRYSRRKLTVAFGLILAFSEPDLSKNENLFQEIKKKNIQL